MKRTAAELTRYLGQLPSRKRLHGNLAIDAKILIFSQAERPLRIEKRALRPGALATAHFPRKKIALTLQNKTD